MHTQLGTDYIEVSASTPILEEIIFQREQIDIFHHRTIATPWAHLDIGDEFSKSWRIYYVDS